MCVVHYYSRVYCIVNEVNLHLVVMLVSYFATLTADDAV